MSETTEAELEDLQRRAGAVHCYCNRHRTWDPARGRGDLERRYRGYGEKGTSLLAYRDFQVVFTY